MYFIEARHIADIVFIDPNWRIRLFGQPFRHFLTPIAALSEEGVFISGDAEWHGPEGEDVPEHVQVTPDADNCECERPSS